MRRVVVEVVEIDAQQRGEIVELGGEAVEALRRGAERLVEGGRLADQALRDAHGVERRGLVLAGKQAERASGALQQLAGVAQPFALLRRASRPRRARTSAASISAI